MCIYNIMEKDKGKSLALNSQEAIGATLHLRWILSEEQKLQDESAGVGGCGWLGRGMDFLKYWYMVLCSWG